MRKSIPRRRFILVLSCAALLSIFSSAAQAYIPPSFFVVRQVARKHSDINNIRLINRVTFFRGNSPLGSPLEETVEITNGEKANITLRNASGEVVASVRRHFSSSKDSGTTPSSLPLLYSLQFISNSALIFDHLRQNGLSVKSQAQLYSDKDSTREDLPYKLENSMALGRFKNRIALVLNGDGRSQVPPQVWVEKDSYLPLRLLQKPEGESEVLDIQPRLYQVYKSTLFPNAIDVFKGGALWVKIELSKADMVAKATSESGFRDNGSASGDLKDDLEQYIKWIR